MTRTTLPQFITNLAALTVTGVTRAFAIGETPPPILADANLPAMWVQRFGRISHMISYHSAVNIGQYWDNLHADLVIAVQGQGTDTEPGKIAEKCITIEDALNMALQIAHAADTIANEGITWTTDVVPRLTVGAVEYWGVVAHVTTEGPNV